MVNSRKVMNASNDPQLLNFEVVVNFHCLVDFHRLVDFHCLVNFQWVVVVNFHCLVDFHRLVDFQWNLIVLSVLKRPLQQEQARIES